MRSYWLKIGFGAMLIFAVGFGLISAGRKAKSTFVSSRDIEIPLGAFIPFKLEGSQVGTIRSITIRRSTPNTLSGFNLRLRTTDTATFAKLTGCSLSVSDAHNIDERTTFVCLRSDSGYQAFGEVSVDLRTENDNRTVVRPLLLPHAAVAELQRGGEAPRSNGHADSIAAEVRVRIQPLRALYNDSIEAARLDQSSARYLRRADSIKQRADSIRARGKADPSPATNAPVVPRPPPP